MHTPINKSASILAKHLKVNKEKRERTKKSETVTLNDRNVFGIFLQLLQVDDQRDKKKMDNRHLSLSLSRNTWRKSSMGIT